MFGRRSPLIFLVFLCSTCSYLLYHWTNPIAVSEVIWQLKGHPSAWSSRTWKCCFPPSQTPKCGKPFKILARNWLQACTLPFGKIFSQIIIPFFMTDSKRIWLILHQPLYLRVETSILGKSWTLSCKQIQRSLGLLLPLWHSWRGRALIISNHVRFRF